ncbi:tRNA (adenosine(37)-N6)-threonylcarbamoyltransferase complex dimerization subunit type 1 TsaB [Rickettsia endosymbiont of Halotydeus destructor]|uniref:tRNA (adenosine(37)-N6)-threonylcarbamoyltransferase complex dimerization subunit type 1 TsaB n=1 Tax=Rickettsia endosymbiont of Halotydeus destructor TaxID=2996754 RepID=UPI003BB08AC8
MKILAFDTTNNTASVALSENENILAYQEELASSKQAEAILPMIEKVLESAKCKYEDIDYLAVTNGPGSFTGIRIGLSVAKAILFSTKIKGLAVSNFEFTYFRAIEQVKNYNKIYVFLNAYRGQLYSQVFDKTGADSKPVLIDYEHAIKLLTEDSGNIACAGSGVEFIYPQIKHLPNLVILPRFARVKAFIICRYVTDRLNREQYINNSIEPLYIRPPDAKVSKNHSNNFQ